MKNKTLFVAIFLFVINVNSLYAQDIDGKSSFFVAGVSANTFKNNKLTIYAGYSPSDNLKALVVLPSFVINKYLTFIPGYTYAGIKPDGISTLYEHQILASAVFSFPVAKNWTITDRNMYFYRFRKDLADLSFYRNRLGINHRTQLLKKELNIYLYDEVFLNLDNGTINRNRIILGGEIKLLEWLNPQIIYMYQTDRILGNKHLGWLIFTISLENLGLFKR
ncbi:MULTISPECIES: DUF2490 domain-containing protein [Chryseobacterium]|uniref:DUF2490 domain-containing protein n=1 Tax=Chryseobacterium TaxID=59732 RepID=UPI00129811CF|nr:MULTISPECIES: DUF2490 domain-containing protein [Chryseobacterium]MDR6919841.1 hypothetical protein [Chryseobacterium sp. 2987]